MCANDNRAKCRGQSEFLTLKIMMWQQQKTEVADSPGWIQGRTVT
jgi:hypothetical protein